MELKYIVGIVVTTVILILVFSAGDKNDYKKKRDMFPLCLTIPFTGHEICIRPYTPKSSRKHPKRQARAAKTHRGLKRLQQKGTT
tara:strand:- start:127 stop:381 length:255 start_codon:yes stop_codon:yes gene_type:complete